MVGLMAGPTLMPMVMKAQKHDAKIAVVRGNWEKFMGRSFLRTLPAVMQDKAIRC